MQSLQKFLRLIVIFFIVTGCTPSPQNIVAIPSSEEKEIIFTPIPTYTPLPKPVVNLPFPVGKPIEEGYEKITIKNVEQLVPIRELPLGTAKHRQITNIEFSADGTNLLISQSDYSYIKFMLPYNKFDLPWRGTGNATWTEKPGGYATFSPDGKWMVWGNDEDEIVFETTDTNGNVVSSSFESKYTSFGFSPDGSIFFATSNEGTSFYDFNSGVGERIAKFSAGQPALSLYQGTQVLILQDNDRACILGKGLYSISRNSQINDIYGCQFANKGSVSRQDNGLTLVGKYMRLWDVGTNVILFEEDPIKGEQHFSQDMTSENYLPGARLHLQHGVPYDGSVYYLSISDDQGAEKSKLQLPGEPSLFIISPDGKFLAVGIHSFQTVGDVLVFAVPTWMDGKIVNIKDYTNEEITFSEYSELISSTLISIPELETISRDNITQLKVIGEISAFVRPNLVTSYEWDLKPGFNSISFSPDGKYLALSYAIYGYWSYFNEFALVNLASSTIKPIFWSHRIPRTNPLKIMFSPDGKTIAYLDNPNGDYDPDLIIRSFHDGEISEIVKTIEPCNAFYISRDNSSVICLDDTDSNFNIITSYRISTGEIIASQKAYWWGGIGRLNPDNSLTIWSDKTSSKTYQMPDFNPLPNFNPIDRELDFSYDGSIAAYCAEGNLGTIYNWPDRKLLYQKGPCPLAFSNDGSMAVGLDRDQNSLACGQMIIWDVQTREQIGIMPSQIENTSHYSNDESVWGCLAGKAVLSDNYIFSPDGKIIIQVNNIYQDGRSGEVLTFLGVPE